MKGKRSSQNYSQYVEGHVSNPVGQPGGDGSNIVDNQLQEDGMAQDVPLYTESAQAPDLGNQQGKFQPFGTTNYRQYNEDLANSGRFFTNMEQDFQNNKQQKKTKSKMQYGDLVDMFQPLMGTTKDKKVQIRKSKSSKSSIGKQKDQQALSDKQTENLDQCERVNNRKEQDQTSQASKEQKPKVAKGKKKKEAMSKAKSKSPPKQQNKDQKFENQQENVKEFKRRGRPPKANLCQDNNEMTQPDEKMKRMDNKESKQKQQRKSTNRGKYGKKKKQESELSDDSDSRKMHVSEDNSDQSMSQRSQSMDDDSFAYSPPKKVVEPVVTKAKAKPKTQMTKKDREEIQIVEKSVYDTFMELNAKTLKWQQDHSLPIPGSETDEKTFLQNTLVNNNFTVFVIDSIWIQKLRLYMSQAFQIYNNTLQINDESAKKKSTKMKSKQAKNEEIDMKDQQKNLISLSQSFYETCESLTNKPLIDQPARNRTGLNILKKLTYIEQYDVILPCFHKFLLQHANIFNINTKQYVPIKRKYIRSSIGIRTCLDLYHQLVILKYNGAKLHFQFSINTQISQMKKEIQNCIQINDNHFSIQAYSLIKENQQSKTLIDEGKLKDYMNLVEIKKQMPIIIELIKKEQAQNNESYNSQRPALFHDCNYCRQNSLKLIKRKNQKKITYSCICQNVYYCSEECAKNDLNFHKHQCLKSKNEVQNLDEWNYDIDFGNQLKYADRRGLVGLQNLTNSCYMNCTLQCLSHCKALTNYFLKGTFINEINNQNPLGSQGLLAIAFAQVIKQLWSGEQPVVIPQNFKSVLARFKKQFANLEQQDSQELLNILLDSLSEDLNRVKVKPLVPMIESHGENDLKASYDSWKNHLKRSQSIIVDLMHGQFKSTVRCPELDCNHLSITFEPFMMISLPIPEIKLISKQFVWVPYDMKKKCSVHKFVIKGHESIKNLRKYIVNEILSQHGLCYDPNGFEIVQIQQDKIKRIMCNNNQAIGLQNQSQHLFVFELDKINSPIKVKMADKIPTPAVPSNINEEIDSRLNENTILSFLNFQIHDYVLENQPQNRSQRSSGNEENDKAENETYFPRLKFFKLNDSLIQIHLEIFNQIKHQFTRFLELREAMMHKGGYNSNQNKSHQRHVSTIEDKLFFKKLSMNIPLHLTLEKWNRMTLEEQYELVFSCNSQGFKDPSRRKPHEIPYFIRLVSRKTMRVKWQSQESSEIEIGFEDNKIEQSRESKKQGFDKEVLQCIYCKRIKCSGCPLPFEDKLTLKDFLSNAKVPIRSTYFFQDDDCFNEKQAALKQAKKDYQSKLNKIMKQNELIKKNQKLQSNKKQQQKGLELIPVPEENMEEDDNQDFEVIVQFNKNNCWGLYELLVRGQNQRATLMSSLQKQKAAKKTDTEQKNLLLEQHLKGQDNEYFIDKVTISDCFRQFDRPEKLSWQNEWYCDHCKQHKQAVKKIQVYKTPPILIINLKRFKGHIQNQKQNTPVHYPIKGLQMNDFMIKTQDEMPNESQEEINLEQKIMNDNIYDLFAVVLHTGTLNGGHYTAIAKNKKAWYEFNDDKVFKLNRHERHRIVSNHAYILFYQKRGIDFDNIEDYNLIRNTLSNQQGCGIKFPIMQFPKESDDEEEQEDDDEQEEERQGEENVHQQPSPNQVVPESPGPRGEIHDEKESSPVYQLLPQSQDMSPLDLKVAEVKQVIEMKRPGKSFRFIMDEPFSDRSSFIEVNHSVGNGFPRKKTYWEWVEDDLENQYQIDFQQQIDEQIDLHQSESDSSESSKSPETRHFIPKRRLKYLQKKQSLRVKLNLKPSPIRKRQKKTKGQKAILSLPLVSNSELLLRSDEVIKLPNHQNLIEQQLMRNFLMNNKRMKQKIECQNHINDLDDISKAIRQNKSSMSKLGQNIASQVDNLASTAKHVVSTRLNQLCKIGPPPQIQPIDLKALHKGGLRLFGQNCGNESSGLGLLKPKTVLAESVLHAAIEKPQLQIVQSQKLPAAPAASDANRCKGPFMIIRDSGRKQPSQGVQRSANNGKVQSARVESATSKAAAGAAAPSSAGRGRGRPRRAEAAGAQPQAGASPKTRKAIRKINQNNRNYDEEMHQENDKLHHEDEEMQNQNSDGDGELHDMRSQIVLKEEFLKKLNGLINDRNFVIDQSLYAVLVNKLQPMLNDQMILGEQKIDANTKVISNMMVEDTQNGNIKQFIKHIQLQNQKNTDKIEMYLDHADIPEESNIASNKNQKQEFEISETFSNRLEFNQSLNSHDYPGEENDSDISRQIQAIEAIQENSNLIIYKNDEDQNQIQAIYPEKTEAPIVMEMPQIEPIIERVRYEGSKRYKYVGDWCKEAKVKKRNALGDVASSRRSAEISESAMAEQVVSEPPQPKRRVGRPRKSEGQKAAAAAPKAATPKRRKGGRPSHAQTQQQFADNKGLTDFSLTPSPARDNMDQNQAADNRQVSSIQSNMVVQLNHSQDLNEFMRNQFSQPHLQDGLSESHSSKDKEWKNTRDEPTYKRKRRKNN